MIWKCNNEWLGVPTVAQMYTRSLGGNSILTWAWSSVNWQDLGQALLHHSYEHGFGVWRSFLQMCLDRIYRNWCVYRDWQQAELLMEAGGGIWLWNSPSTQYSVTQPNSCTSGGHPPPRDHQEGSSWPEHYSCWFTQLRATVDWAPFWESAVWDEQMLLIFQRADSRTLPQADFSWNVCSCPEF